MFGVVSVIVYRSYASDLTPPEEAIASVTIGQSIAYDRNGQYLYQYVDPQGGLRNPVPLDQISPYLIAATIATEDASFYDNPGVNFSGLARAAVENFTPFGPGFLAGSGGSSITQQLVKNIYISPSDRLDRKVSRKLKETVLALELKRKYDDNQILEWYLNQIFYGNDAYGAEAASQRFFGKSAKDLTLGEAALLVGLPQAPGDYDPTNPAKQALAKQRQAQVLDLMIEHLDNVNKIKSLSDPSQPMLQLTADQINGARDEPLNYITNQIDIRAPHFVRYVEDQVTKMCQAGLFSAPGDVACDKVVGQGGLRITTSLDLGLNDIANQMLEEKIAANEDRYGGHDGSLVAIQPSTGEILAYVGSRDFWREDISGQVDIASSEKSHGSTMKMFTYLTAFEQGSVPSTYVDDKELLLDVGGEKRPVNNWNFSYLGSITMRKAISESVNTAAVRTVMADGIDNMRDMAHRMGITDLRQADCGPTITLGACEVKLVDMTYAFSVLANNGVMKGRPTSEDLPSGYRELDPVSVLKILDAQGNMIYQYGQPESRQVVDPAYAYMVTDVLSKDAISWARVPLDRPAAAKTGTSENFRDNVVMGYTPDLAAGVWMGNADNTPMAPGTFSSAGTGPTWQAFMLAAHKYLQIPPHPFEKPADVVTVSCNGHDEPFKVDESPTKPGACRAPKRPGEATASPKPRGPVFPVRGTPTPTPSPTPEPTDTPEPAGATPVPFPYTVREGDTLDSIAKRFHTTTDAIIAANDLASEDIFPGDKLLIPIVLKPTHAGGQAGSAPDSGSGQH